MDDTVKVIGLLVVIAFAVIILPRILGRLIGKGVGAAFDAGQKAVFKKQIAESDDLIDVPLVLTSSASPEAIMAALDAIIHPSKEPPKFAEILYETSHEPMRVVYAFGSKLQPQQLVTELRLSEHDGKTEIVFRVLTAVRTDNIFICKEVLLRLREQVQYVAECGDDSAKLTEGAHIYRALEPEVAKRTNAIFRVGAVLSAAAVFWLGAGIQIRLLPVWFLLAAVAGVLVYIGRKPVAKLERESSAAAAKVLHPEMAAPPAPAVTLAPPAPDVPDVAVAVPAAAAPALQPMAPATAAVSVEPAAPLDAIKAAVQRAVSWFMALPKQTKIAAAIGAGAVMFVTVMVFVIVVVGVLGLGSFRSSYAGTSTPAEDLTLEPGDIGVEVDPYALSPDTHARMEDDLFYSAPSDGSMEFSDVVYAGGGDGEDDVVSLEFTLVSRSPAEWYIMYVPIDTGWYIDYNEVSMSQFFDAINGASDVKGMIVYDNEAVYELHIFTQGQKASASTPEKDQVTIVPDFREFSLSAAEAESMEWGDALDAYVACVEKGFADAGLVAVVELVPYGGTKVEAQDPEAGMAVPVGTKVYLTIEIAD